jgi:Fe-S-cluster containining protein
MYALEPPFAGVNGVAPGHDIYWDALPESLKLEIVDFRTNIRPNTPGDQPCIWLDLATKRCRHYDYRPRLCRDFELGGEDCLGFRAVHVPIASVPKELGIES